MNEILLIASVLVNICVLILVIFNLRKSSTDSFEPVKKEFEEISEKYFIKSSAQLKDEFSRNREESRTSEKSAREEISKSINSFGDQLSKRMTEISTLQKNQLDSFEKKLNILTESTQERFDRLQDKISLHLKEIRDSNDKKLEEMRVTVDEKLHTTLEKRLGESFKIVSERLEIVHKGLGEMQTLANGVGDLKKVLTNVKTRGTWGEVQLENLIDQILTPDQYSRNVEVKQGSREMVDFAVKLPGRGENKNEQVWLPIDAKFPLEDYQRLIEAQETGDIPAIESASKEIEKRIKIEAKSISEKYINPPATTDFAVLFLPIEGLYAEVLRRTGLADNLQRENRIVIAGPTNIAALLNSLQMGFKTLAIEKRSSEVWSTLGEVKTEFVKFGDILDKTQLKLEQASKTIGDAKTRTRAIERKLRDVQEFPVNEKEDLFLED